MSRMGKQPIIIPDGVSVSMKDQVFTARSPKGELHVPTSEKIKVTIDGSTVTVTPASKGKDINAIWGLMRTLINNAVSGVNTGWEKVLEVRGVGYRAQLKGKKLDLQIGKSHPIVVDPPGGITFETSQKNIEGENAQIIKIKGIDKQLVGEAAANIRKFRPPEPYKGKGIRYVDEYVARKAGKAAAKASA